MSMPFIPSHRWLAPPLRHLHKFPATSSILIPLNLSSRQSFISLWIRRARGSAMAVRPSDDSGPRTRSKGLAWKRPNDRRAHRTDLAVDVGVDRPSESSSTATGDARAERREPDLSSNADHCLLPTVSMPTLLASGSHGPYLDAIQRRLWSKEKRGGLEDKLRQVEREKVQEAEREAFLERKIEQERERLTRERMAARARRESRRRISEKPSSSSSLPAARSTGLRSRPRPEQGRLEYQEAWRMLLARPGGHAALQLEELPLPVKGLGRDLATADERFARLTADNIRMFLLGGIADARERRAVLRQAYLWHPDRFQRRLGQIGGIVERDQAEVLLIVNRIAGIINDLVVEVGAESIV